MRAWRVWEKSEKKIGGGSREKKFKEYFFEKEHVQRRYKFKKEMKKIMRNKKYDLKKIVIFNYCTISFNL